MKKIFSGIGHVLLPFRGVKRMVGVEQLKESYLSTIRDPAREILNRGEKRPVIKETFEEAVARLNMTEADIESRKKSFFKTTLLFLGLAFVIFIYAINLLFSGQFLATFIAAVLVLIGLALAVRDHFWYTQMRERRLGISLKEWLLLTFGGGSHHE